MRFLAGLLFLCAALMTASFADAQPPPGGKGKGGKGGPGGPFRGRAVSVDEMVTRMMALDADKDGKLTRSEVTDVRLHRLFDRADANKDGVVTKEELTALLTKELAADRSAPGGFGGPGGRGPGGRGPGGPPPGGPPRP